MLKTVDKQIEEILRSESELEDWQRHYLKFCERGGKHFTYKGRLMQYLQKLVYKGVDVEEISDHTNYKAITIKNHIRTYTFGEETSGEILTKLKSYYGEL